MADHVQPPGSLGSPTSEAWIDPGLSRLCRAGGGRARFLPSI